MRAAARSIADSVVQIRTIGGLEQVDDVLLGEGASSGLIVSEDGYILSSAFQFAQQPSSILVTLPSGERLAAELVATDHSRMLVLLKVRASGALPVPRFAPVEEIRVGQWAIAVGRAFVPQETNVTVGIVSAVNRMFGKAIQTDAAISAANYGGPLVDLHGRVLGLIVPMAPQATSQVAGVQWYDSGIGFAVPLAAMNDRIELMKSGEDQHPGLLGIALKSGSPYITPPELAAVRPQGPAGQAELKKGDLITHVDGAAVKTQAELRFQLSPLYAGDLVHLILARRGETLERDITLVAELEPFRHPYLGIVPDSPGAAESEDAGEGGITVRAVLPGTPAAAAGVEAGDVIHRLNETPLASLDDALTELNSLLRGTQIEIGVRRGEQELSLTLTAAALNFAIPDVLPPRTAVTAPLPPENAPQARDEEDGVREVRLPEFPHECRAYVPPSADAEGSAGLLLWLAALSGDEVEAALRQWQPHCDRYGLVLAVPSPPRAEGWEQTDLEYLARLLGRLRREFNVDPHRMAVHGRRETGELAYALSLAQRENIRGVSVAAAALPRGIDPPDNDPTLRLSILSAVPMDSQETEIIRMRLDVLAEAGYPVERLTISDSLGRLMDAEIANLARWLDSLDRF